jgi:hypothetical protein
MNIFNKILALSLTIPTLLFFSMFTLSNSNLTFISLWPFDFKIFLPIWALSLGFFFIGLFLGCALMFVYKLNNYFK